MRRIGSLTMLQTGTQGGLRQALHPYASPSAEFQRRNWWPPRKFNTDVERAECKYELKRCLNYVIETRQRLQLNPYSRRGSSGLIRWASFSLRLHASRRPDCQSGFLGGKRQMKFAPAVMHVDLPGSEITLISTPNAVTCAERCAEGNACRAYSWSSGKQLCSLKNDVPGAKFCATCTSGVLFP